MLIVFLIVMIINVNGENFTVDIDKIPYYGGHIQPVPYKEAFLPLIFHTSLAVDTNDNLIVTWEKLGRWYSIHAHRINESGTTLGQEIWVDQSYSKINMYPSIAVDSNNNFVITWMSEKESDYDIHARRFNSGGNPISDEFTVNQNTAGEQWYPSIAVDSNNNFVITWMDDSNKTTRIHVRKFDDKGNPLTEDVGIYSTESFQMYPSLKIDSKDNVIIALIRWPTENERLETQSFAVETVKLDSSLHNKLCSSVAGLLYVSQPGYPKPQIILLTTPIILMLSLIFIIIAFIIVRKRLRVKR